MHKRGILCLLLVSLAGALPAIAGNPNEATGFPTHSVMLDGPGGDSISAYNGSLELGIPIGPTWELPGMSWGLTLHYSSKIWRIQEGRHIDSTLARRGPFGVGWILTMGRIFSACREGCNWTNSLAYEDPSGTLHPIHLDYGSQSGNIVPGMTTDGTYMRVEVALLDPNNPYVADYYLLYPGNGIVMTFDGDFGADFHSGAAYMSQDFTGLRLSRMEKRGPDPNVVLSWVEVDYETDLDKAHCIKEIRDGLGSSTIPLRTISFTNAPLSHGGNTIEISMPGVVGQASTTATYRFVYSSRGFFWDDAGSYVTISGQNVLSRIELPADPNWSGDYAYTFEYEVINGEMKRRTLPTGAVIEYVHSTYSYSTGGVTDVHLREVREKCIGLCSVQSNSNRWTYFRLHGAGGGPVHTVVKDPFGNQSKYYFIESSEVGTNPWKFGLTERIDTFSGAPLHPASGWWSAGGALVFDTQTITYEYGNFGTVTVPDVRMVTSQTNYPRNITVTHRNPLPYGNFGETLEWGPGGSATYYERKIIRDFEEPLTGTARWANWVIGALGDLKVLGRYGTGADGNGEQLRRTRWTYLDDGKVETQTSLKDFAGPGPGDIITNYAYDPNTGLLDTVTLSGGDTADEFKTKHFYSPQSYLVGKQTEDLSAPQYRSFDVDRDPLTGTVLRQRDPTGIQTSFEYDFLGRTTRTVPPAPEEPIDTIYVSLNQTRARRGPATGDRIESTTYLDSLGRVVEERRQVDATKVVTKTSCYDVLGRPLFVSEWRVPGTGEVAGSPNCDPNTGFGGFNGSTFDYKFLQNDVMVTDAKGRLHEMTAADGSERRIAYADLSSTVTNTHVNAEPSTGLGSVVSTDFSRDWMGRLTYVDPPEGADARYIYNGVGELVLVELLEEPPYENPLSQLIQTREFSYDHLGRLRSANNPESGTVEYTRYDAAGNILEKIESDGTRFTMDYDDAGRLLTVMSELQDPNGGYLPARFLARYRYDTYDGEPGVTSGYGRLTEVKSYDDVGAFVAKKTLRYAGLNGRLDEEATTFPMWDGVFASTPGEPTFKTCYNYDIRGLLDSLRYPAEAACGSAAPYTATLRYLYSYGQLKGMNDSRRNPAPVPTDPNSWRLIDGVTYNNAGGLQALSYANGVDITITPDLMYRPSRIKVQGPGGGPNWTYLDTGTYKYDGVGNIIAIGADAYSYDFIGRLKTATVHHEIDNNDEDIYGLTYTYDDFGNMTREDRVVTPGGSSAKIFNVAEHTNRIQNMGDPNQPFLFDPRGNLRRDETQRYHFDERNRLVAVKKEISAWPVGDYTYDAGGLRIMKTDPVTGQRIFYVRDGSGNILSEFIPSGAGIAEGFWQKDYFYALGRVIGHAEEERPRPVEGLTSSVSISANQVTVTLNWLPNEDPGLTGYLVYRKDPNSGMGWQLASSMSNPITTTSWVDPQTFPDTGWRFYRVAALAGSYEGVTSRSLRVDPGTPLSDPTGFTAHATETSVVLIWNQLLEDMDGLSPEPTKTFVGYNVYRKDDPNSSVWNLLNPTPLRERRFYDLGTEEGDDYLYMLRAVDSLGNETQGLVTTTASPLDAPSAPTHVQAFTSGTAGRILVRWWPNSEGDLTNYRVYHYEMDPNQQLHWALKSTVAATVTEVYIAGLAEGQDHEFAVSAKDLLGESPLSASASARPRVAYPQAPIVIRSEDWMAYVAGSSMFDYYLPVEELEQMKEFRVYRKLQNLPDDQWALVFTDTVYHPSGYPPYHTGRYIDRWPYRCSVTEYMITGVRLDGEMIEDTWIHESSGFIVPRGPLVTLIEGRGQNPDKLRFDVQGLIYCQMTGSEFKVVDWAINVNRHILDPFQFHTIHIDPNVGWVEAPLPDPATINSWTYTLLAEIWNYHDSPGPSSPFNYWSMSATDICIDSAGNIMADTTCFDADGSQQGPPPPLCWPDCDGTGGGGSGAVFDFQGPHVDAETWQNPPMRMALAKPGRNARMRVAPEMEGIDLAAPEDKEVRIAEKQPTRDAPRTGPDVRRITLAQRTSSIQSEPPGCASCRGRASEIEAPSTNAPAPAGDGENGWMSLGALTDGTRTSADLTGRQRSEWGRVAACSDNAMALDMNRMLDVPAHGTSLESVADDGSVSAPPQRLTHQVLDAGGLNLLPMLISGGEAKSYRWTFYGWDHLGSTRLVTDESGSMGWGMTYLPYGERLTINSTQALNPSHTFAGHEHDHEADLEYMHSRYYSASLMAFVSVDRSDLQINPHVPLSWNRYAYVLRNPLRYVDPDGHATQTKVKVKSDNEASVTTKETHFDENGDIVTTTQTTTVETGEDGTVTETTETEVERTHMDMGLEDAETSSSGVFTTVQSFDSPEGFARAQGVDVKTGTGSPNLSSISAASLASMTVVGQVARASGMPTPVVTSGREGKHGKNSLHYATPSRALDYRGNNVNDSALRAFARDVQLALGGSYDAIAEFDAGNSRNDHLHVEYDP